MDWLEGYEERHVLRALGGMAVAVVAPDLAPAVPVLDAALVQRGQALRRDKLSALMESLREGEQDLTPEVVRSDEFLSAFFATAEAAVRTERREKVLYFGRLLLSGIGERAKYDLRTEHEGYLNLLDDLTYREIGILATLRDFEAANEKSELPVHEREKMPYWEPFVSTICGRFSIRPEEADLVLTRLNRTGLYVSVSGGMRFGGPIMGGGYKGRLTSLYHRVAELIRLGSWGERPEESLRR